MRPVWKATLGIAAASAVAAGLVLGAIAAKHSPAPEPLDMNIHPGPPGALSLPVGEAEHADTAARIARVSGWPRWPDGASRDDGVRRVRLGDLAKDPASYTGSPVRLFVESTAEHGTEDGHRFVRMTAWSDDSGTEVVAYLHERYARGIAATGVSTDGIGFLTCWVDPSSSGSVRLVGCAAHPQRRG